MKIGADEKRNFKTAAYIILLIKDSDAFILEGCFWSVCVSVGAFMLICMSVCVHNSVSLMCMCMYSMSLSMLVCWCLGKCLLMQIRYE